MSYYEPTTNFKDSNGIDLGKKLLTKDYLLEVYGSLLDSNVAGLTETPALWTWGNNADGQLGVNNITNRSTPVTTLLGGTNWKSIACGGYHTVAIKTDGTLWLWGNNVFGLLGTNGGQSRRTPVTTLLGGTNWKSVACGFLHTAAIKTDGTLWIWGAGDHGRLGVNNITNRLTPVTTLLGGTNWKSVSCGGQHTVAIKTDGTLWSWGQNSSGQLGINNAINKSTPVTTLLGGTNWKSVDCGDFHTAAIKTDGTLWTWGNVSGGRLGINDTANDRFTPVTTFAGGTNWKSVAGGDFHTAAIKTDGTLWTWGGGGFGQLGVNNITLRNTPVTTLLGGTNWKSVDCGSDHTAAIKTDGTLWTWGRNTGPIGGIGQLGVNDITSRSTPVTTLLGGNNWKSVSGGEYNTAAIQSVDYI